VIFSCTLFEVAAMFCLQMCYTLPVVNILHVYVDFVPKVLSCIYQSLRTFLCCSNELSSLHVFEVSVMFAAVFSALIYVIMLQNALLLENSFYLKGK